MDWIGLAGVLLGGTSLLGIIGFFIFFKQRAAIENLNVNEKDVQVSALALEVVRKAEEHLSGKYDKIVELEKIIQENNQIITMHAQKQKEMDYIIKEHERKIRGMNQAIKRQVNRKKYAERLLCTKEDCILRLPPLGTYRSDDDECNDCEHNQEYLAQQNDKNTNENKSERERNNKTE